MSGMAHVLTQSVAQSWQAAVAVTAAAYGVDPAVLGAESRGRGPRPPADIWEPRKMAVHLAVVISGVSYAALGRHIGLHRDTVASHCADVRDAIHDEIESASLALEPLAKSLERLARARLVALHSNRIDAVRAHLAMLEQATAELVGSSDELRQSHPTNTRVSIEPHGNVIKIARNR